jgi:hypothetical protein
MLLIPLVNAAFEYAKATIDHAKTIRDHEAYIRTIEIFYYKNPDRKVPHEKTQIN